MGHGRTLLGLKKKEKLNAIVEKVLAEELNVRQLEALINQLNQNVPRETSKPPKKEKDVFIKEQESFLRERFGTSVTIKQTKKKEKLKLSSFQMKTLKGFLNC